MWVLLFLSGVLFICLLLLFFFVLFFVCLGFFIFFIFLFFFGGGDFRARVFMCVRDERGVYGMGKKIWNFAPRLLCKMYTSV